MRARFITALSAVAVAATVAVGPAPTAHAALSCSLDAPARISIGQPYAEHDASLGADCMTADVVAAGWELSHPATGGINGVFFENTSTEVFDVLDTDPLGPYTWQPIGAWDSADNEVTQPSRSMDVRVASWSSLAGGRTGSTVSFTISLARYSGGYHKYIPWASKVGSVQYRSKGTSTWNHLTYVKTNASGKAFITRSLASTYEFRVQFPSETYIWGVWTLPKAL